MGGEKGVAIRAEEMTGGKREYLGQNFEKRVQKNKGNFKPLIHPTHGFH